MACFDSGQAHLTSNTQPVLLFTVSTAGLKNVALVSKTTSGSVFVGNSPNLTPSTGMLVPNGLPFSIPAVASQGTTHGNKPNVSASTGHFVPANVPVQINLKANQGTTCYGVAAGAATITWMFGA